MRSKNVLYSLATSFIYQLVNALMNFIVVRLFLISFGSEINGLALTITQIINYLKLVEAGIALTGIVALYKPIGQSNYPKINSILSACNQLYKRTGYLFLILTLIVSIAYPLLIDSNEAYYKITILIIVMSGGSIVEYFVNGKMQVLLVADQKSYILNTFLILTVIITSILKIKAINLGFDYLVVQGMFIIGMLIRTFLTAKYIKRKYPYINYRVKPDYSSMGQRWSVLSHQISGLIVFNTPLIIVSIFCGLKDASIYGIYNLIFGALITILQLFSKSTVSSFGNLIYQESHTSLIEIFKNYETLFYTFSTWLYCIGFIMVNPFIELYTKGVNDASYTNELLTVMFLIVGLFNAYRIPLNTLIEASGHYTQTRNRAAIEATINVIASLIAVQFFALYGVLLGSIVSYLYRSIDIILYSSGKILLIKPTNSLIKILLNVLLLIITINLMNGLVAVSIQSWMDWITYAVVFSLILGILFLLVAELMNKGLIKDLFVRLRRIIS
ncbi:lipopolysaccharide biosynthesis protein [Peribacillus sp. SCS-155]|uniref:lipopolysaccharide biosynthesis protein n=1 Tax=Peribacillus sedimenti TaxID=3115297 RepID=UPI003906BE24